MLLCYQAGLVLWIRSGGLGARSGSCSTDKVNVRHRIGKTDKACVPILACVSLGPYDRTLNERPIMVPKRPRDGADCSRYKEPQRSRSAFL